MRRLTRSFYIFTAFFLAFAPGIAIAQNQNQNAAVFIISTEKLLFGRTAVGHCKGTLVKIDGQIVVVTAGHCVEPKESTSYIQRVQIFFNGREISPLRWESKLNRERDIGFIYLAQEDQADLSQFAVNIANDSGNRLVFADKSGGVRAVTCTNMTTRNGMVLRDPEDSIHPTTQVALTASCDNSALVGGQSGTGLFDSDGNLVAVFFADIQGQQGFNAAFSRIER